MKTKHFKEKQLDDAPSFLNNSEASYWTDGYNTSLERTNAQQLLEKSNNLVNKFGSAKQVKELGIEKELNELIDAIKKATE